MTNKSDQPVFGKSIKNEDNIYEDDGFFSDVPAPGSLSKSQRALNKYMKTNLLYENGEESDRNSDYFSKETSPNESVSKYDSESVLSDESFDKKQPFLSVSNSESRNSSFSPTNDFTAIQKNTVQDVQTMNVTLNNADKVIDVHTDTDKIHATKDNIDFIIEKHSDNYTTPTSNGVAEQNLSDDVKNAVRSNAPNILQERTENRKSLITENNRSKINPHLVSTNISEAQKNNSNTRRKLIYQSSDDMNIVKPKQIEQNASVVLRKNSIKTQAMDNRHTIHEFDNWGNRTTIYPDVYAPLPYKSPRRYVEGDVNIHYRCPVRRAPLPLVPERELARQQADHMKRLYREQRRAKYLQELQDMQNRRHQDNFTPAQKNILPLNRYDEADRTAARALYAFNGQTPRELSFKKGDFINVRRQIDSNWYEGELHGRIGLFPYNYLEILKGDVAQSAKKPPAQEGKARAKFDFTAQTSLELPLKKGEVVVLTRRIDHNWWEGRTGNKTGIFPDSYVQVLQEPSQNKPDPQLNSDKPLASPASHGQVAGAARRSMGSHSYTPQLNSPALANAPPATQPLPARPAQSALTPSDRGYGPPPGVDLNNTEPLYVDTNAEAVPYRAMYKYRPQNPDELELREGDTVYVLEQCDDGWYVGSSQRSGRLGTFPGNYVERI